MMLMIVITVISLTVACLLALKVQMSLAKVGSGSFALMREMQFHSSKGKIKKAYTMSIGGFILFTIIGIFTHTYWAGLTFIIPLVLTVKATGKLSNNAQHKQDGRAVAKGAAKVGYVGARTGLKVAGTVTANPALLAADKALGVAANQVQAIASGQEAAPAPMNFANAFRQLHPEAPAQVLQSATSMVEYLGYNPTSVEAANEILAIECKGGVDI